MPLSIIQFAKKVGMTKEELRVRSSSLGFNIEADAKVIEDDLADLLYEEFTNELKDTADAYDEIIGKELEKEIIKTQRKKTAGKPPLKEKKANEAPAPTTSRDKKTIIEIPDTISVKEFAEKTGLTPVQVIGQLMHNGILANINQQIDYETAHIIAQEMSIQIKRKHTAAESEDILKGDIEKLLKEDDPSLLVTRPPVVSIMGHVDHGKTQLLDSIRNTNVIATEAGGITQHIGAYQINKKGKIITFLDTPGHEAFTAMRARGARATDIAILVVAADEGVKPQTIEAINHAKEAKIPIIVALNKMDKPNANPQRVMGELSEYGLNPEEWGGDTIMVPVSALKNQGLDKLLEMILVVAELSDLKANPTRPAVGTVIEAHLDTNLGPVATILINAGTLKIMDSVIVGGTHGRIKLMKDANNNRLNQLKPSDVAQIAGLNKTPQAGDLLQVVNNERIARQKAEEISGLIKEGAIQNMGMGLSEIVNQIQEGKLKTVKVVLKADTKGSLEAIKESIANELKSAEVAVKIIHSGVGNITESDVMMAAASQGLVIGFHTNVTPQVDRLSERLRTEVVVYKILDDLKKLLMGLLEPEIAIVELGKAKVLKIFYTQKTEMVLGCKILEGKAKAKAKIRVEHQKEIIGEGILESLKIVNEEVKEVEKGGECGIRFKGKPKIEEGDILQFYTEETRHKTL